MTEFIAICIGGIAMLFGLPTARGEEKIRIRAMRAGAAAFLWGFQ